MSLSTNPATVLTSRDVARLFSGIIGVALQGGTSPNDIADAFEHFEEHKEHYRKLWLNMRYGKIGEPL